MNMQSTLLNNGMVTTLLLHFAFCLCSVAAQAPFAGMYEITSGDYIECCGLGGESRFILPSSSQRFVSLRVQNNSATMTFLGADMQTVFSRAKCPGPGGINLSFDHGLIFPDKIIFHVDPSPPPDAISWNYTVTASANELQIHGALNAAQQLCADVITKFTHTNVIATLLTPPRIQVTEFSKEGVLLFIQGHADWTDVIEASTDLINWTGISTNIMPNTDCPICPFITFRDSASLNLPYRFYRCFEKP
jgi:hypothetical protein